MPPRWPRFWVVYVRCGTYTKCGRELLWCRWPITGSWSAEFGHALDGGGCDEVASKVRCQATWGNPCS
jgi:hypothetical protein